MNSVVSLPDSGAVRRGLSREDVFVVLHDSHWSETADYADVILPAPTHFEKGDLVVSYSHPYIKLSNRVIEPLGESRDEVWLMREIARRLGIDEESIFEDPVEALGEALKPSIDTSNRRSLLAGEILMLKQAPRDSYPTPSGRIEFYSTRALKVGIPPLPSQLSIRVDAGELILITSSTPKYTNSQFREVYGGVDTVYLNPRDAERIGIRDGDIVNLYNGLGEVVARARLTEDVPEGVAWAPRQLKGLNGEPVNTLTPAVTQQLGGGPVFNSTIVKIRRWGRNLKLCGPQDTCRGSREHTPRG
jgi:anaerobic selenocysteine-containing dehydrogenase